jgi:signal peptidase I
MQIEKRHIALAINYGKYIGLIIVVAAFVKFYRRNDFVRIPPKNDQMSPKIQATSGDGKSSDLSWVIVNPTEEACLEPKVNSIIRFEWQRRGSGDKSAPEWVHIGRIIALEGDRIRIDKGKVFVNGSAVEQDYVGEKYEKDTYEEIIVPKEHAYILVDNRKAFDQRLGYFLRDSRQLGMIPYYLITGVVTQIKGE